MAEKKTNGTNRVHKGRTTLAYVVLIILSFLCLFFFYVLLVNATRNHFQIQKGFSFVPGKSLVRNLKAVLNDANIPVLSGIKNSLIVSVCRQLVVILPAAWILGQQFGLNAVWYSFPIAEIAAFFISYILLWREYRTELRFLGVEREAKA